MSDSKIKLFESAQIRAEWDADTQKWWFSIVDVVAILTESVDATAYWRKLKQRLKAEGNETVTVCHGLKMRADGKRYKTATDISLVRDPQGFDESAKVAKEGAKTAKAARVQLEKSTGKEPLIYSYLSFCAKGARAPVVAAIHDWHALEHGLQRLRLTASRRMTIYSVCP
jgi:hypothetical protein